MNRAKRRAATVIAILAASIRAIQAAKTHANILAAKKTAIAGDAAADGAVVDAAASAMSAVANLASQISKFRVHQPHLPGSTMKTATSPKSSKSAPVAATATASKRKM